MNNETPCDDNVVISPDWLESVGFEKRTGPGWKSTHIKRSVNGGLSVCSQFGNVWWNQEHLRFCKTRGEVRRLVTAMGLDASEGVLIQKSPEGQWSTCEWEYNNEHGRWDTECDSVIALHASESPFEYGFKFCPYCGKEVRETSS